MASLKYRTDFLTTLAYLLGEKSVNSSTSAPRADFVQESLKEAYQAYPWRFARANATLTISNGLATLPTNYDEAHKSYAKFDNGSEIDLDEVHDADSDELQDGDRAIWIEAIGDGDRFALNTKDSDVTTALFKYQKKAPVLDSDDTVGTPYPNKMTIALGARRYVKLGQNPEADISQDEALFDKRLNNDIAAEQVPSPRKRRRTAHGQTGHYTGRF